MTRDIPALLIDGRAFEGWTEMRITRGLERLASDFMLTVSTRWPGQEKDWPLKPFQPCVLKLGADVVLTGYVDHIEGTMDDQTLYFNLGGRSRTADLIDCCALVEGGEFRNSTLVAICRAVAQPFAIEVADPQGAGAYLVKADAADQTETCFRFLERLSRMAGCLLTDDAQGRLVLAKLGEDRATSALVEGENVPAANFFVEVEQRFDRYVVKSQAPNAAAYDSDVDGAGVEATRPGTRARSQISAVVWDEAVPRYRPHVLQTEGARDAEEARRRALWQARRDAAQCLRVKVTVPGWRQSDGRLWQVNERAHVALPRFGIDEELLIASVSHELKLRGGSQTILTLTHPDAFTPEPLKGRKEDGASRGGIPRWISRDLQSARG